ncbi:O-antigen ligase family protein [Hyphobacterium sp. CCMP332]|nr:O-antigen ligase family protein [Hyphobacterium sp. CCMP332]
MINIRISESLNTGKGKLRLWIIVFLCLSVLLVSFLELQGIIFLISLPLLIFIPATLIKKPKQAIWFSFVMAFFISGFSRYISIPWGLSIDIILFLAWIGLAFHKNVKWKRLNNDIFILSLIWFGYICIEFINPNGNGALAWFYAMRGIGFYQILSFGIVFLFFDEKRDLEKFIYLLIALSILGTIWGFKQQLGFLDFAENHWLFAENHQDEHILHGVLRVFSFYSDAGQFGANQAMVSLLCSVLFLGPHSFFKKSIFLIAALVCFLGFAISGTRGALAIPAFGGLFYLIASRNFKVLFSGIIFFLLIFLILKYTFMFQGIEQVRRMRSALDPNNPSLMVRLQNQKVFGEYLADKPFGGGIGTAGYWGFRFNPGSLMANTATDSWYVKIWAETGIVGITFHIATLMYIMAMGFKVTGNIKSQNLRSYALALYAAIGGVLFSSYGNQVFGQMPTGMIMNLAIPFLFIIHKIDQKENS